MKVLVISHSCVADVNQQQFVALGRLPGVQIELILPARWKSEYAGRPQPPRLLPAVDFPVHCLPVALPGQVSLHFYKRLPLARLRRFGPDVVLSAEEPWSLSGLQAVWLSRKLGAALVFQTNQNISKRYPPPFSLIERLSYRRASVALAYSEEARQVMLRKGLRKPSRVVPYGTDVALFHGEPNAALRRELGLGESVVLGYLGRFVPEKGLDTFVEAVAQIVGREPEAPIKALMVGAGPEEQSLRRAIEAAGLRERFVFTGAVSHKEAGAYLRCMDVLVLPSRTTPSWKEQFGRVIIESLACGVPVVGSNSGQIPHLLRDTGGGLVFQEGDAGDLAEKLGALAGDAALRRRLGAQGGQTVRRRYTCEAVADQLYRVFEEALASAGDTRETVPSPLLRLTRFLPKRLIRWVSVKQHQYPLLKSAYRRIAGTAKGSDQRIQAGVGQGLRFNVGRSTLGYLLGTVEPQIQTLLPRICGPGDVVYDIGGNVGFFTVVLARIVGPEGEVVSFEPMPETFAALTHNVAINGFTNVRPVGKAVSQRSETLRIGVSAYDSTHKVVGTSAVEEVVEVPGICLDDFVFEEGARPPRLVKIDVEGHEEAVLRGMRRVIAQYAPLILCEVHGTNRVLSPLLEEFGYWQAVVEEPGKPLAEAHWNAHVLAGPASMQPLREDLFS